MLLLLRTLLEVLCYGRYFFQRPVPSPSSALTHDVSLERKVTFWIQFTAYGSRGRGK